MPSERAILSYNAPVTEFSSRESRETSEMSTGMPVKTIRDREELRIDVGVALAIVSGFAGGWLTYQLLPDSTGHISRFLCTGAFGFGAAWLGWRLGIVLPDLDDLKLRSERIRRIRTRSVEVVGALVAPGNWVICLFAAACVLSVKLLIEQNPLGLLEYGTLGLRQLSFAVTTGVLCGVAGVVGGWLGYHAQRIALDDPRRDEERRPNR